ncbi:hypothetical protein [Winogradskyella forsetii]|uniref:hypothetical protein n=1 Tax=Winogradskyella forsetii TaxID=2686077 RepID=UPI0015B82B01|nr:hypothetical protein [Winogradskyella forsetii]
MNYIKHLNAIFQKFYADKRLNTTHVSLYMALFQFWNINRFPEEFYIDRQEVMQLSKIGSTATYHGCLKQMHKWKYLKYMPSHNPYKGSKIKMFNFGTTSEQVVNKHETSTEQALIPNTNSNKQKENINKLKLPKNENDVIIFFKSKKWAEREAKKFFNHYESIGWKLGGKIKITNWHSTAENWMIKAEEIKKSHTTIEDSQNWDNLKTKKVKDYDQPL